LNMHAIGIDIGGTKIAGALVSADGVIVRESRVPTPATEPDAIADAVVGLIQNLSEGVEVTAAGVAAAGFVDAARANIVYAPNLSWRNEPFKAKLEAKLDIPVFIDNDANAAGWAEYRFGAGRGYRHMVMLTIGTGVGGAIIADGKLLRGGFGVAAELGHIRHIPNGRLCGCGRHGCIEQYGSGTALLKSAIELANTDPDKGARLAELMRENQGELTGVQVYQAISEHDPGALGLLRDLGVAMGKTIATLAAVLDPEIVVIGGGVSAAGELLLEPMREGFISSLSAKGFRPELKIETAQFVNDAGVVGAADLARQELSGR
jgi:glucokinase